MPNEETVTIYIREDSKTAGPHTTRTPGHHECIEVGGLLDLFQHLVEVVGKSVDNAEERREQ